MPKQLKIIVLDKRIKDKRRLADIRIKAIMKYRKTKWLQDRLKELGGVIFTVVSKHRRVGVHIKR